MSIWGSDDQVARCAAPYLEPMAGKFYATAGSLGEVERGGWIDFATSVGMCDLARLSVARDVRLSDEVELFLDEAQVGALVAAGQRWLRNVAAARAARAARGGS